MLAVTSMALRTPISLKLSVFVLIFFCLLSMSYMVSRDVEVTIAHAIEVHVPPQSVNNVGDYQIAMPRVEYTYRPKECKSLAQDAEDVFYMDKILPLKGKTREQAGWVLESGALNGVHLSNTFVLEMCHGWRSIHVEGDPVTYPDLVKNRPLAYNIHAILCENAREITWSQTSGPVAGVVDTMSDKFKSTWGISHTAHSKYKCTPLRPILETIFQSRSCHIDVWFLDVEGAELEVIKSFPFDKCTVGAIIYEADGGNVTKDRAVAEYAMAHTSLQLHHECAPRSMCLV